LKGKVEVFLELEEVSEIEKQAKEKGISRSAFIREAVLEYIRKAVEYRNNKVLEGK
jgi:metal-responsive CopG/Arc/MetJ family transcriptional regulator